MARRDVEKELGALKALESAGAEERERSLRKALRDRVNVIVAKAATMASVLQIQALIPDLCAAFERMLLKPVESDPQCWAKNAIVKALADLGHKEAAIFLRGVGHLQPEPVWGRLEDTAGTLRGTCALALVTVVDLPRRDILQQLTLALTDTYDAPETWQCERAAPVRRDAARAIEQMGGEEAGLLLRLKARAGDCDVSVTGQVFDSLLRLEGIGALAFVGAFLAANDGSVREEAALSLGSSRLAEAVAILIDVCQSASDEDLRRVIFRGLSASRHEHAIEFLLNRIHTGKQREAVAAIEALAAYPIPEALRLRIREVAAKRSEESVARAVAIAIS